MNRFLNSLNRFLVPATALLVLIALWKLASSINTTNVYSKGISLVHNRFSLQVVCLIAVVLWTVVVAGWIHSKRTRNTETHEGKMLMDILDRLTIDLSVTHDSC